MILTTSLSDALLALSEDGRCPVDGVEVGSYFSVEQLKRYRARLPEWRFYFHPGNVLSASHLTSWALRRLRAYLACAPTPWVSCHLSILAPGAATLALRHGLYPFPAPDRTRSTRQVLARIMRLQSVLGVPVTLENMPMLPDARGVRYRLETDTGWIGEILAASGCGLLLDLGHARIAASRLGRDARDYLRCLPLERVIQIHVSGPRMRNGYLFDAHESLEAADYALLEWALGETAPRVVTLEYFREREALRVQIAHLRQILGS